MIDAVKDLFRKRKLKKYRQYYKKKWKKILRK